MKWRPIKTAPKDVNILGFEKGYGVTITWWRDDGEDSGWRNPHYGWRPTHWIPLPKPPQD